MRSVGNWLTDHTQKVVINVFYSGWQPITSVVPEGLILGPMLSHVFINYTGDGTESTFTKFPGGAKRGGEVNTPEGQGIQQRGLVGWKVSY